MTPEASPDTRAGALLLGGLRRGILTVWLPIALAGQAVAWLGFAISGLYGPWSWVKIGFAYTLLGFGVPFETSADVDGDVVAGIGVQLLIGALAIAALVLSFRAGRDQARGLERRPAAGALAGAAIATGVALATLASALLVRLTFLEPLYLIGLAPRPVAGVLAASLVAGLAGTIGGVAAARAGLEARTPWGPRVVAAARAGFTALWWGVALAFVGFLLLAALRPGPTAAYARVVGRQGSGGAMLLVHHALLVPNQSSLLLAAAMGVPIDFEAHAVHDASGAEALSDEPANGRVRLTYAGLEGQGGLGGLVGPADFPMWFVAFLAVPAVATFMGGRVAATGLRPGVEGALRALLGGIVFAGSVGVVVWAAAISLPIPVFESKLSLGAGPIRAVLVALPWGVVSGILGSRWPARQRAEDVATGPSLR